MTNSDTDVSECKTNIMIASLILMIPNDYFQYQFTDSQKN